jgi:ribonuclease Z
MAPFLRRVPGAGGAATLARVDEIALFFAGTSASVPTANRGLPAQLLRADGQRILFDCGEGTQRQLIRSIGLPEIDCIFLTHLHADHCLGVPGLVKTFELRGRERELDIFGPRGTARLLEGFDISPGRTGFPLAITELAAGDALEFDGFRVEPFAVRHRGPAFGYSVVEDERPGRFDVERARSLGIEEGPDFAALARGESVGDVQSDQVVGEPRPGRRIVLSGDTAPSDAVRAAAWEADLLVHEASFMQADAERAGETGHSTARQAAELAAESRARMLALVHVSSRYPIREVRQEAQELFENTVVPRDFDAVRIPVPEKGAPELVRPPAPETEPSTA